MMKAMLRKIVITSAKTKQANLTRRLQLPRICLSREKCQQPHLEAMVDGAGSRAYCGQLAQRTGLRGHCPVVVP